MTTEDGLLRFFDPTCTNDSDQLSRAAFRLVKTLCEAIDCDELRMPKDGLRIAFERALRNTAKAMKLHLHSDALLSVDESMADIEATKILGKLFCKDGRELPAIKRFDGVTFR